MVSKKVADFFREFEAAGNSLDVAVTERQFNEVFLHGDPQKVQTVQRTDLIKALPMRKAMFDKLGLQTTKVTVTEQIDFSPFYTLAKVAVAMHFTTSSGPKQLDQTATYMLKLDGEEMKIVAYINDQLLQELLAQNGLTAN